MGTIDRKYRWLLDFCGFYKGEERDPYEEELKRHEVDNSHLPPPESMKTEYRGLSVRRRKDLEDSSFYWGYESSWVGMMMNGGVDVWVLEEAMHHCPRSCEVDYGLPPAGDTIYVHPEYEEIRLLHLNNHGCLSR